MGHVASASANTTSTCAERTPRPVPRCENPDQPPCVLAANIVTKNDKGEDLPRERQLPGGRQSAP